jgi:hypothetical protein
MASYCILLTLSLGSWTAGQWHSETVGQRISGTVGHKVERDFYWSALIVGLHVAAKRAFLFSRGKRDIPFRPFLYIRNPHQKDAIEILVNLFYLQYGN